MFLGKWKRYIFRDRGSNKHFTDDAKLRSPDGIELVRDPLWPRSAWPWLDASSTSVRHALSTHNWHPRPWLPRRRRLRLPHRCPQPSPRPSSTAPSLTIEHPVLVLYLSFLLVLALGGRLLPLPYLTGATPWPCSQATPTLANPSTLGCRLLPLPPSHRSSAMAMLAGDTERAPAMAPSPWPGPTVATTARPP
jgi:hypothetical protein